MENEQNKPRISKTLLHLESIINPITINPITINPNDPDYTTNSVSISTTNPETTGSIINYTQHDISITTGITYLNDSTISR